MVGITSKEHATGSPDPVAAPVPFSPELVRDGYHCQTNSLAKLFAHAECPLFEEMLLGLGAGMGFIYWQQKGAPPFIGGRGNNKDLFTDLGSRCGVAIEQRTTKSAARAEAAVLEQLSAGKPVMVFADMAFLPWFELPDDYHFGGHTFVLCGYDGAETVLGSDMDQRASGLKPALSHPLTLEQLRAARGSEYKPFPPGNAYLDIDFASFHQPGAEDVVSAVRQAAVAMREPPTGTSQHLQRQLGAQIKPQLTALDRERIAAHH